MSVTPSPFKCRLANEALHDAHVRNDPHWTLRNVASDVLYAMDWMLVRDKHPLAYQPGTVGERFCALARAGHQFEVHA